MGVLSHLSDSTRKRIILVACILGSTIVFVDSTVVNVALPAIQRELGVATFGVTSILCAVALNGPELIVARGLQGITGALLTPAALATITATFSGEERGAAIGTWTAWTGISFVIGPLLGGWLVSVGSWRSIFAVNIPFVIATLALVRIAVPGRDMTRKRAR